MSSVGVVSPLAELQSSRDRNLELLDSIRQAVFHSGWSDPAILRLMAIPLMYSTWENTFTLGLSLCLRYHLTNYRRARDCPPKARAFWLRKASFYQSFIGTMRNLLPVERRA